MPNAQRLTPVALYIAVALSSLAAWCQEPSTKVAKRPSNRLAKETSPYLLLHAHNPVDWYSWGAEALAKAKAEKKLIFLSIGYSSCYWCHVMERESFMDDEIAAFMNKHFVCIKVDREERPDIDEIYMAALHALGRPGGWPLTMFLTPDAKPFFGGTYFPPRDKELPPAFEGGPPQRATGFLTLLALVADRWQKAPDELSGVGDQLADHLRRELSKDELMPQALDDNVIEVAAAALTDQFDAEHGGFGYSAANARRPKFPEPSNLMLLIDRVRRTNDDNARKMLVVTLEKMAAGGIRDHLGGGFHRYSTDRFWLVPHFEKMLYDNGQLASVYAEAWQLTSRDDFRQVAEEILAFVSREMTDDCGGFYAAIDAETDGDEGAFYVWTREELRQALNGNEYKQFAAVYGVDGDANFEERYVLRLAQPLADVARQERLSAAELQGGLRASREKLLAIRNRRNRPLTDTKIIAGWNGLMIRGFADAGRLFDDESYLAAARRAADAVLEHLRTSDDRLLHCYTAGQAKLNAYLDDYAFFIDGLLALHRATNEKRWLDAAAELAATQQRLFWDDRSGGFFFTSDDHESLLARPKDPIDSATPSGNSVAAGNLAYLAAALNDGDYLSRAEKTVAAFARFLNRSPAAMPRMVVSWSAIQSQK